MALFGGNLSEFDAEAVLTRALRQQDNEKRQRPRERFMKLHGKLEAKPQLQEKPALWCHVCRGMGHKAGYLGAHYLDCPKKACFLCKREGHMTLTCPYRVRLRGPDGGASKYQKAQELSRERVSRDMVTHLGKREMTGRRFPSRALPPPPPGGSCASPGRWELAAAARRMHSQRTSVLTFHPMRTNLLVSGDKTGEVAVWDFEGEASSVTVMKPHECNIKGLGFGGSDGEIIYGSGIDGRLSATDLLTEQSRVLLDLNPHQDYTSATCKSWKAFYALAVDSSAGMLLAGDAGGAVTVCDPRAKGPVSKHQMFKDKIISLQCHPRLPSLLLSSCKDHSVRIFDMRRPPPASPTRKRVAAQFLLGHDHPRIVTSAVFSPSGEKLLTTCSDNRLRVWDDWVSGFGHGNATTEIVHSQDANRYLSPFAAVFDPKDPMERRLVCGRYISEAIEDKALHPIDVLDASTGCLLAEISHPGVKHISPLVAVHGTKDVIASAASSSAYLWSWRPQEEEQGDDEREQGDEGEQGEPEGEEKDEETASCSAQTKRMISSEHWGKRKGQTKAKSGMMEGRRVSARRPGATSTKKTMKRMKRTKQPPEEREGLQRVSNTPAAASASASAPAATAVSPPPVSLSSMRSPFFTGEATAPQRPRKRGRLRWDSKGSGAAPNCLEFYASPSPSDNSSNSQP